MYRTDGGLFFYTLELKVYGNYGKPILVFPSSGGAFHEYEGFKMIEAVAPYINEDRAKFFCIDGIDKDTWLNKGARDEHIAGRHAANFYFKRPDVFDAVIALSGIYNAEKVLNRHCATQKIYFNSPLHYLDNLSDPQAWIDFWGHDVNHDWPWWRVQMPIFM